MRRIIQFGTKINDILRFPMDLDQWEDSWNDEVEPSLLELEFADGSFRNLGFEQSRKKTKTLSKRFILNLSGLDSYSITKYHDHVIRTLRGGVKKLIAEREDESLMWTWAEAVNVNYIRSGEGERNQIVYSVDFVANCPYWYSFRDGSLAFWSVPNLDGYFDLCNSTADTSFELISCRETGGLCDGCLELIIEDQAFGLLKGCVEGCTPNNDLLKKFGEVTKPEAIGTCITSSAGFGLEVTLLNNWINPVINFAGGTIGYNGVIQDGQYITFNTLHYNGNLASIVEETNTPNGIDPINLGYTAPTRSVGQIDVTTQGGGTTGLIAVNFIEQYHN